VPAPSSPTPETPSWEPALTAALTRGLGRIPAELPASVLFSGGLDSGLLAWELRARSGVTLTTIGYPGSHDLAAAEDGARRLGLPWVAHHVTGTEVAAMDQRLADETNALSPTARSVEVAFALAVASAPPGIVICGQGADELFFGYAHFRGLDRAAAIARGDADLAYLLAEAWPRARRIAAGMGRTVEAPYLEPAFLEVARQIPVDERRAGPAPKQLLRNYARGRGLPESIAFRPKKALQYGTGVDRQLRRTRGPARPPT
jgi:asparagine synthase (glutamine-hydrolysing)